MSAPVVLAVASAACFLGLARAAVITSRTPFRRVTALLGAIAGALALLSPAAGVALLAPVLFSRRLATVAVPATVPELLDRYPARRSR
ncbi:MAG: hypothetical protein KY454_07290 [Actinobacteria bacterium]|nr:hypothetical protein [Actinomycetota bacterium]MBW3649652.1 hypothetical protein [Actinomycetota bacterium]